MTTKVRPLQLDMSLPHQIFLIWQEWYKTVIILKLIIGSELTSSGCIVLYWLDCLYWTMKSVKDVPTSCTCASQMREFKTVEKFYIKPMPIYLVLIIFHSRLKIFVMAYMANLTDPELMWDTYQTSESFRQVLFSFVYLNHTNKASFFIHSYSTVWNQDASH